MFQYIHWLVKTQDNNESDIHTWLKEFKEIFKITVRITNKKTVFSTLNNQYEITFSKIENNAYEALTPS